VVKRPGYKIQIPLMVLTVLSLVGGFVNLPPKLGNVPLFTRLLETTLPPVEQGRFGRLTEIRSEGFVILAFLIGLGLAYLLYMRRRQRLDALTATRAGKALHEFWFADWGFDWCYDKLFVQPVLWFARVDKKDGVDAFYNGVGDLNELLYRGLRLTENGRVRWYAAAIAAGTVVFVAIALFL
jgi:NADH-quinone oxidoreductase subunit L